MYKEICVSFISMSAHGNLPTTCVHLLCDALISGISWFARSLPAINIVVVYACLSLGAFPAVYWADPGQVVAEF